MESEPKVSTVSDDYYLDEVLSRESNDTKDYGIDPDFRSEDEEYIDLFDSIDDLESELEEDEE